MKKLLYGLIGLVILLVAAVFIVPALIDWNGYKEDIAAEVRAATGREIAIDGDISVTLLPSPHASVSGIRFANVEGATESDMLRLEQASADIALWPLFSGDIEVESVSLINPEITLEITEDGAASWDLAPAEQAPAEAGGEGFDMRLDDVRIENGRVRYIDTGTEVATLEDLDAQLAAESLSGPFSANGSAALNGLAFRFDAGLGSLADAPQFALRIMTDAGAGEASVEGAIANGGFVGTVALAAQSGQDFIAALANAAGSDFTPPDMLAGPLALYTELSASAEAISADALRLTLGESELTGHARLLSPPDAAQSFDVALAGERVDVDAILAAMSSGDGADGEPGGGFTLPTDVTGRLALQAGTVVFQGGEIADAVLEARMADGSLSIERASATLPGSSPVALQGTLQSQGGAPAFAGTVELSSSAPRTLLGWAQVNVGTLPDAAMQSFSFNGVVDAGATAVRLDPFSLRLDDSTAQGSLALGLGATPSVSLRGNVDRIDVDRYIGGGGSDGGNGGGNPFEAFNADVNVTFGALTLGGNAYSPVTAIASVSGGALTIEQLSGIGPGGTAFSVNGSVSDPSAPAFALDFDVSHPNLQQLLTAFGMDGGGAPAVGIAAVGHAESDGAAVSISNLDAQLGDSDIAGTITAGLGTSVEINADLSSRRLNLDTLLPGGGGGGGGERWSSEPIDLAFLRGVSGRIGWSVGRLAMAPTGLDNARLEATLADGVLTIDSLTGALGGGTVAVSGQIQAGEVPSVALSFTGEGITFEPGVLAIGDVSLDGARIDVGLNVAGSGVSMADMVRRLNGDASLSVAGGVLNGLNLGAWQDTLNTLSGAVVSLDGLLGSLGGGFEQGFLGGQTQIGSLAGTFAIQGGEVFTDDLALITDVATVELDGAASLPAWTISALGLAEIRESVLDEVPAIPFGLGGPLDSPSFQPDFTALQLFLGTGVMGLSLDELPADVLAGLPIQGLSADMLRGINPQQLIQALTSGQSGIGPEAFQQLLQGGEGDALVPQPDLALQQLIGEQDGEDDPAAALQRLLTGEPASPETAAVPEDPAGAEGEADAIVEPVQEDAGEDSTETSQTEAPEPEGDLSAEPEGEGDANAPVSDEVVEPVEQPDSDDPSPAPADTVDQAEEPVEESPSTGEVPGAVPQQGEQDASDDVEPTSADTPADVGADEPEAADEPAPDPTLTPDAETAPSADQEQGTAVEPAEPDPVAEPVPSAEEDGTAADGEADQAGAAEEPAAVQPEEQPAATQGETEGESEDAETTEPSSPDAVEQAPAAEESVSDPQPAEDEQAGEEEECDPELDPECVVPDEEAQPSE